MSKLNVASVRVESVDEVGNGRKRHFAKIMRREAPADIVYQDDLVTAFWDIGKRVHPCTS